MSSALTIAIDRVKDNEHANRLGQPAMTPLSTDQFGYLCKYLVSLKGGRA